VLNPKGFHVYFWTDEKLQIALRCDIGEPVYNVTNLRKEIVDKKMFELPSGYKRAERVWKPLIRDHRCCEISITLIDAEKGGKTLAR
jgi:hypothetical protein